MVIQAVAVTLEDEGGEREANQFARLCGDVPRTVGPVRVVVWVAWGGEGP